MEKMNFELVFKFDRATTNAKNVIPKTDRGYEDYNLFVHAQEKKWKFLLRAIKNGIKELDKVVETADKTTERPINLGDVKKIIRIVIRSIWMQRASSCPSNIILLGIMGHVPTKD
jgi:hypothetical protein